MNTGCPHATFHWYDWKLCRGTPDGPGEGAYVSQGGFCHRCRLPVVRTRLMLPWGEPEFLSANPVARGGPADSERRRTG